jgi:hypothetical protein
MSECLNAGMSGKKVGAASASLTLVNRVSLTSAFRHLDQPGAVGHRKVSFCPALANSLVFLHLCGAACQHHLQPKPQLPQIRPEKKRILGSTLVTLCLGVK